MIYNGFYSNILLNNEDIATAFEGKVSNGFTTMHISYLDDKNLEGATPLLDLNIKALKPFKQDLKDGKIVNVHLEWKLSDDRMDYDYYKVLKVEVEEK